ncbi:hypothetical protein [Aquimarina sp. 2201CG14-23]|uniref:hypothetical protein n=1 Tax=Aquimarina mycalae TaxID=3040073 RepID=UPI002477D9EB|nr:hypothetical protein [Aquimarina sp. 2201CG14-23]MDH7445706.1 hypothetical protein [Aquimarina sp. 2201CG14-23]
MKKIILLCLIILSVQIKAQEKTVVVGNSTTTYVTITEVQNTGNWTEISLEFKPTNDINGTLHPPTSRSPFVLSDQKGNRYALKNQMGWEGPDAGGYGTVKLVPNQKKYLKLFFNKLEKIDDIYSLTELGCEKGCWNFYDISLKDKIIETPKKENVSTKFTRTWVDYNVTEDEKKGMRIHAEFTVFNLKDTECYMLVRFADKNEKFLTTTKIAYKNVSGQISLYKKLTPKFDKTYYADVNVFMPYTEFNLSKEYHDLKYDVDLIYKDGGIIKHFEMVSFYYDNK